MCEGGEVVSEDLGETGAPASGPRVRGDAHNDGTKDNDVVAEHHLVRPDRKSLVAPMKPSPAGECRPRKKTDGARGAEYT
jgi:hypothetical protein